MSGKLNTLSMEMTCFFLLSDRSGDWESDARFALAQSFTSDNSEKDEKAELKRDKGI
jgi:hypothetical protein